MSLDVWFKQDIHDTLLALANVQSCQPSYSEVVEAHSLRERSAYRDGFNAALKSVARAFSVTLILQHKIDQRAVLNMSHRSGPY